MRSEIKEYQAVEEAEMKFVKSVAEGDSKYAKDYKLERVIDGIKNDVEPDIIRVMENVALIATVGHGMSSSIGTSARLFKAMAQANINAKLIDQGSSELSITVGVRNEDCEKCISAIYHEFFS